MSSRYQRLIVGGITAFITVSMVLGETLWARATEAPASPQPAIATVQSAYGKLPLSFEVNEGQTDAQVQFFTRGKGHALYLTPTAAVLTLQTRDANVERGADPARQPGGSPAPAHSMVRMSFTGADPQAKVVGLDRLPGIVNYFIGADPAQWRTNIPTYQKVAYHNLYPGIDVVYYGNQGRLEYDLIVAPGADPTQIRLAFEGAEQLVVDQEGDLVLTVPHASTERATGPVPMIHLQKPVVYQRDERGGKHLLDGTYVLLADESASDHAASVTIHPCKTPQVAFHVASYDTSRPLIIDPILSWATYLGSGGGASGLGVAVDQAGNAYVTGSIGVFNFPGTTSSPIQPMFGGGDGDAYVTKLNAAGTAILYATYLGGNGNEAGNGIAVDVAGNAYVTGWTSSSNFPGTADSAIQKTLSNSQDAFVTKLNATGTALAYSTYLGGSDDVTEDMGRRIAVDGSGNAYVVGETNSSDFPGTADSAIQPLFGGGFSDAFITKLNAAGTAIVYSTYLGGSNDDRGFGIAVDGAENVYVTGGTDSSNFPGTASSPIQPTFGGGFSNAFVTKVNAAGTAILYSTYLGGSAGDTGGGIAVDGAGNAFVTGGTGSSNFPGTASSPIQNALGGFGDAFVTKVNAAGTAILYSTYLGGSGSDFGFGIAVDGAGNAFVAGRTDSSNFPRTASSPIQSTFGGGFDDAFVTELNAAGTAILYSTYLGGSNGDRSFGLAVDAVGSAYVTGNTDSSNFPGTAGSSIQPTFDGSGAFVVKITSNIPFAAFGVRAEIELHHRPNHEEIESHHRSRDDAESRGHRGHGDEFELKATFTLGSGSNGIAPLTEAVTVQIGTFSTTIPAGSFKQHKGRFVFEGTINGVRLEATFRSLILGNDYEVKIEGRGANLTGTKNPVTVSLTIGDDSGSKATTAKIK